MPLNKTPRQGIFPSWAKDGEDITGTFERYSHLPSADELKARALFGIPLKSGLTGETISDETINHYINAAISEIEHELDLYITPVTFEEKHDYRRQDFTWSYNYTKLNHPNVISVEEVQLSFSNDTENLGFVQFPMEHVHLMPQEGVIQLVPAFGTSLSGFLLSAFSGTQFHALRAIGLDTFPGGVRVKYTSGFEVGKVPTAVVELVENMAAWKLLSFLGPLIFPHTSVGVSMDGVSQSVGTAGPQFLVNRIKDLETIIEKQKDAIKGYYQRKYQIDSF
ncbi:hypothetical protein GOV06_00645 [Candidatus Woesearchaeota archaeon]|nr:hypothetical protein [Candidatus Woesearchaeota archaeon]